MVKSKLRSEDEKDIATSLYHNCENEYTRAIDIHFDESYNITREKAIDKYKTCKIIPYIV